MAWLPSLFTLATTGFRYLQISADPPLSVGPALEEVIDISTFIIYSLQSITSVGFCALEFAAFAHFNIALHCMLKIQRSWESSFAPTVGRFRDTYYRYYYMKFFVDCCHIFMRVCVVYCFFAFLLFRSCSRRRS